MPVTLTDLTETSSLAEAVLDQGVIKGVKLLGEKSKNGNRYPRRVREAAHDVFEGCKVNINHGKGSAEVQSRIGKLVNVREQKDGTYADFHFLTSHPWAQTIVEASRRMPDAYGFSINGQGRVKKVKGESVVESIDSIKSVDLVADPGTVTSLFEQEEEAEGKSVLQLVGELIAALVAEGKEDMVKEIIKFKKKLGGGEDENGNGAEPAPAEEAPAEESWKQEYASLKLEKDCRTLLEQENVPVEQALVESLMSMSDDSARTKFVAWHKKSRLAKQARSSEAPPVQRKVDYVQILRN